MGYQGHVFSDGIACILDMKYDIEKTIGKTIEMGFVHTIPENEKKYILHNAKVGIDVNGAYIHFFLEENKKIIEFIIKGIKNFTYDINPTFRKYWVSTSDELLYVPKEGEESYPVQTGDDTYRFMLFIDENE